MHRLVSPTVSQQEVTFRTVSCAYLAGRLRQRSLRRGFHPPWDMSCNFGMLLAMGNRWAIDIRYTLAFTLFELVAEAVSGTRRLGRWSRFRRSGK